MNLIFDDFLWIDSNIQHCNSILSSEECQSIVGPLLKTCHLEAATASGFHDDVALRGSKNLAALLSGLPKKRLHSLWPSHAFEGPILVPPPMRDQASRME